MASEVGEGQAGKDLGWCFPFGHNWQRWEEPYQTVLTRRVPTDLTYATGEYGEAIQVSETWQKRTCARCGKVQHSKVRNF